MICALQRISRISASPCVRGHENDVRDLRENGRGCVREDIPYRGRGSHVRDPESHGNHMRPAQPLILFSPLSELPLQEGFQEPLKGPFHRPEIQQSRCHHVAADPRITF